MTRTALNGGYKSWSMFCASCDSVIVLTGFFREWEFGTQSGTFNFFSHPLTVFGVYPSTLLFMPIGDGAKDVHTQGHGDSDPGNPTGLNHFLFGTINAFLNEQSGARWKAPKNASHPVCISFRNPLIIEVEIEKPGEVKKKREENFPATNGKLFNQVLSAPRLRLN